MIKGSVGKKGDNNKEDIVLVQLLLNKFIIAGRLALPALVTDGICGKKTIAATKTFQAVFHWLQESRRQGKRAGADAYGANRRYQSTAEGRSKRSVASGGADAIYDERYSDRERGFHGDREAGPVALGRDCLRPLKRR